jgi:hypothetical protein
MDIVDRIGSCRAFAEGKCPCQSLMERFYLVPQLMDPRELRNCEKHGCASDKRPSPHR